MSQAPQNPKSDNNKTASAPVHRRRFHFLHFVMILVTFAVVVFDTGELLKQVNLKAITNPSMFSIPSEISEEFQSCNYNYVFFCEPKPGVAKCRSESVSDSERGVCIALVTSETPEAPTFLTRFLSIPYVNVILYSAVMLPRLPDALIQMLKYRWGMGSLEFSLGVVFVLAYLALMLAALRQKSANLWVFALTVVYGPYLILGVFWLLQHALAGAAAGVSALAAYLISLVGMPACLLGCLGHSAESLLKGAKVADKGAES